MTEIENDKVEPGKIIQEIQAGYMYGERLLRPSLVAVSKKTLKKMKKMRKIMKKKLSNPLYKINQAPYINHYE